MKKILTLAVIVGLTACQSPRNENTKPPAATPDSAITAPVAEFPTDQWLGKWIGPEGTLLEISHLPNPTPLARYHLQLTTLDGVETYPGAAVANTITFTRKGKVEKIRAGSGADTGMKWLADQTNCLVVAPGEGYCR